MSIMFVAMINWFRGRTINNLGDYLFKLYLYGEVIVKRKMDREHPEVFRRCKTIL